MAARANQNFAKRGDHNGARYDYPVAAGVRIFSRAIVAVTASLKAVPAGHTDAEAVIGLANGHADARTTSGLRVEVEKGCFLVPLPSAGAADIGKAVYAVDDNTLSLDPTGNRLKAGFIEAIDEEGVWVRL